MRFLNFKLFVSLKCPFHRTNVITNAFKKRKSEEKMNVNKKENHKNLTISYDGVLDSISFNFYFQLSI